MSINRIILILWCCAMFFISSLLILEYRFFKNQALQLEHLKEDYSSYVSALKKLISEYSQSIDAQGELKKKMNNDTQDSQSKFLVVNREPDYLKKSALSYARLHNLEWAIQMMYESETWVLKTTKAKKHKHRKSHTHLASSGFTNSEEKFRQPNVERLLKKLQREPIFSWPLSKSQFWLSSMFGPRKKINGSWGFHTGIDMAAPRGTLIKAAGDGTVVQAGYSSGYGNTILIMHDSKFKTRYAHLDKILVSVGQKVKQGDYIGKVGATGFVRKSKSGDGSHLHFEVYVYSKHVNPLYFLA